MVTVSDTNWQLKVGSIVGVRFTNSNTASNVKLNVNSTGAKSIYYSSAVYAGTGTTYTGYANRTIYYMYDGTYWVWLSAGWNLDSNTVPSGYCTTAAATQVKTATYSGFALRQGYIYITMTNSNTYTGVIKLNINGTGEKTVYINKQASSSSNYSLPAGSYLIYYDGTNYYFQTDGKIPNAGITSVSVTGTGNVITGLEKDPNDDTSLRATKGKNCVSITISDTEPSGLSQGDFWFQII